jgi:indole-3-glycerol phosphate synthase
MTILDDIIKNKMKEVDQFKSNSTARELEKGRWFNRPIISLTQSLLDKTKTGIIAEFKRRSPSKGIINSTSAIAEIAAGYIRAGASALSILTDNQFFGGSNDDILNIRDESHYPILRKDFIIHELQIIESKSIGADAILLIAAVLDANRIYSLAGLARSLGMEVLLEIHEPDELEKVNQYVSIIGVNNRNLKTFEVNTDISEMLSEKIPDEFYKISESGITSPLTIKKLKDCGFDGFLIGERFMSAPDPVEAFSSFVNDLA